MIISDNAKKFYKATSLTMAFIFFAQQIAWCQGVSGDNIDNAIQRLNDEQSQTFAPVYLQARQELQEDMVELRQEISDCTAIAPRMAGASGNDGLSESGIDDERYIELQGPGAGGVTFQMQAQDGSLPILSGGTAEGSGPAALSLITQSGDIINYKHGRIDYVERADGTILKNICTDGNGEIISAEIICADGATQIISGGLAAALIMADGTELYYGTEGLPCEVVYTDGSRGLFAYTKDADGMVMETSLVESDRTLFYDKDGRLAGVVYSDGRELEYDRGVIASITTELGRYIFEKSDGADSVTATLRRYQGRDGWEAEYGEGGVLMSARLPDGDGCAGEYDGNGVLVSVKSGNLTVTPFYIKTLDKNAGLARSRYNDLYRKYVSAKSRLEDAGTKLDIAAANYAAAQAEYDAVHDMYPSAGPGWLRRVSAADRRELSRVNIALSRARSALAKAKNNYKNTEISYKRAESLKTAAFNDLSAKEARRDAVKSLFNSFPDTIDACRFTSDPPIISAVYDLSGILKEAAGPGGTSFYSYGPDSLTGLPSIMVDRDGIKRIYDRFGNLDRLDMGGVAHIVYEDGTAREIVRQDGAVIKNITFRETGELDDALISYPDGSLAVYRDAELLRIIDGNGGSVDYSDGRIRKVTLPDGSEHYWSYGGGLITITDIVRQERRTYNEGRLVRIQELSGPGLTTEYAYEGAKLARAEIRQDGESLYVYTYTYEDGLTLLHDQCGNAQAYSEDRSLVYMTDSQGRKYSYTYGETMISELTGVAKPDGTTAEYCKGRLVSVKFPDGSVIEDIIFDGEGRAKGYSLKKGGDLSIVLDGRVRSRHGGDGSVAYYENGFLSAIRDAEGNIKEFEYGIADEMVLSSPASGDHENTVIDGSGTDMKLHLGNPLLDLGDGSDGVLEVMCGMRVIDGTKEYERVYVAPGAVLTVSPWNGAEGGEVTIKCIGEFRVEGSLTVAAKGYRGGSGGRPRSPGTAGESYDGTGSGRGGFGSQDCVAQGSGGGGGGHGSSGQNIRSYYGMVYGGGVYGDEDLTILHKGSGGGGGGDDGVRQGGTGGSGGGAVKITAKEIVVEEGGSISADGGSGMFAGNYVGGGGGSGGSVWLIGRDIVIKGSVTASGGIAGNGAGRGGDGRIRIDCMNLEGAPSPAACEKRLEYFKEGFFESGVIEFDGKTIEDISWEGSVPEGAGMSVQFRSGNTIPPDEEWSGWSDPAAASAAVTPVPATGGYIQYRMNLSTSDVSLTPYADFPDGSGVTIDYTRDPLDANDAGSLSYIKVKEAGGVSLYYGNGADMSGSGLILDTEELICDNSGIAEMTERISVYELAAGEKVLAEYNRSTGDPVRITTAEGSVTSFTDGLPALVTDREGNVQVAYSYDADRNVTGVDFVRARRSLQENYEAAKARISYGREDAIAQLEKAECDGRDRIAVRSADMLTQISSERSRLSFERSQYDPALYDLSEFNRAFAQLDDYQERLRKETEKAYADLGSQVAEARMRIDGNYEEAMRELIDIDYRKIMADIVGKESSPIIYHYYRKVLGRDPDSSDLSYWTECAASALSTIEAHQVISYLEAMPEYFEKIGRREAIINGVREFLDIYNASPDQERSAMLISIGMSPGEAADIGPEDADSIVGWLRGQPLHFGDSAIYTIRSALKDNGIERSFEDIGKIAIITDIMSGVITKKTAGDLVISLYAMRKAAGYSGLDMESRKLSYSDLLESVSAGRVIAHIDGSHFVSVTGLDDTLGTVTYLDHTVGAEGASLMVSRAQFMEKWDGFAIAKETPSPQTHRLSVTQEKNIRGSGWWEDFWEGVVEFFQKIVAPVASILMFVPGAQIIGLALHALNVTIQVISLVVSTGTVMDVVWAAVNMAGSCIGSQVLSGIYSAAQGVYSHIGNVFVPVKDILGPAAGVFNWLDGAVSGISAGIGSVFTPAIGESFAGSFVKNIIGMGVDLGADMLFRNLGIDPSLASIGSAFMTGAAMGAVSPDASIIGEALKYGTMAGVEQLGGAAGLDPGIARLAAMMSGTVAGETFSIGGRRIPYEELMRSIAPDIAGECAYIGMAGIGGLFGIDQRLSYLAGAGFRYVAGAGLQYGPDPDAIWDDITDGLADPRTLRVAFDVAGDITGLGSTYGSIVVNIAAGAIGGIAESPDYSMYGFFKGAFDSFIRSSVRAATLGLYDASHAPDKGWDGGYYALRLTDFAEVVRDNGIVRALEIYMGAILMDGAARSIIGSGGIADLLAGRAEVVYEDGVAMKKVAFADGRSLYLDIVTDDVVGRDYGDTKERGFYGVNALTGEFGLMDGRIDSYCGNGGMTYHIKDSVVIERIDIFGENGGYSIVALDPAAGLRLDGDGIPIGGIVNDYAGTRIFGYDHRDDSTSIGLDIQNPKISAGTLSLDLSGISDSGKRDIINYYMLANGINNKNPYWSPGYMDGFAAELACADPGAEDFTFIPLYNEFYGVVTLRGMATVLKNELYAAGLFRDFVAQGYIDENGKVQSRFLDLRSASGMVLSPEFMPVKELAYQLLWDACDHMLSDVGRWISDVYGNSREVTTKIIYELQNRFNGNYPSDMVGFCYSGAGDPFIQAINEPVFDGQYLDVESLILVGTPIRDDRVIANPNVRTLITINGGLFPGEPFHTTDYKISDSLNIQNRIKIVIENAGHSDYFYDPYKPEGNDAFSIKVSRFIAEVTARSKDMKSLGAFLRKVGTTDPNGKYIVDVSEVTYD